MNTVTTLKRPGSTPLRVVPEETRKNYVLPLEHESARDVLVSGGKGASLAHLVHKGFPVPPGFVITASAYESILCSGFGAAGQSSSSCGVRKEALQMLEGAIPPRELLHQLACQFKRFPAGQRFAVRSSSTMEDLAEASFAGMHESYLNCQGEEMVVERILDCYRSLWSVEAVAYREHLGFDHRAARMAVVVQAMVECEVAGVAFSVHPVTGDPTRIVINANAGLGESVVSGRHEVDHYEVIRASGEIESTVIGRKQAKIICNEGRGGTREIALGDRASAEPCLTAAHAAKVATLLKMVDETCGFPQDMEWGIVGDTVHLLQARPITRIPERWTRDESAERFPNALTPLTWDMVDRGFHKSLSHSLRLMGMPAIDGKWFENHGHYIYGNQNIVTLYLGWAPFVARDLDELRSIIPHVRETYQWVQDLPANWARDLDGFLLNIGRLSSSRVEEWEDLQGIWAHVHELVKVGTDYFLPNIAISITQAKIHGLLFNLLRMIVGDEAPRYFESLMSFCETRTWEINRELFELAGMVRDHPPLERMLEENSSRGIVDHNLLENFPAFADRFERFLRDHGHRELDFDAYHPTWVEVPWIVLDNVRLLVRSTGQTEDPVKQEHKLRERMHRAEADFLEQVPSDLRFFFRELIRLARTYTSLDDREHYHTTRLAVPLRRALRTLGSRLVHRGYLRDPMDVFFSTMDAIDEAVKHDTHQGWKEWAVAVAKAKAAYEQDKRRVPPQELGAPPASVEDGEDNMRGIPGSPGTVRAPIYHVRSEADFAAFPQGAILVARTTSPSWTPLFYSASGVITESGGPLSHGAVVARELHIPAVMAVRGALTNLPQGQVVSLDGARGTITIED